MARKIFRFIKSILFSAVSICVFFIVLILLYILSALVLTVIPANFSSVQPEQGVTIYVKSNGVHTDIVMPYEHTLYNWSARIEQKDFRPDTTDYRWVAIGWGDKGFYLETPTWADLTFSTAIDAMVPPSPTAMHVTLYGPMKESERVKKIILTPEQYLVLCDYIYKSFQLDQENDSFILIDTYHYDGVNDNFYEAEGDYHLFRTCNCWTSEALKTAGVKTAYWAPFEKCVMYNRE